MLLRCWLDITAGWQSAFRQQRSFRRALGQALGILAAFGRRTLSRALWAEGRQLLDWSADYRLHARAAWQPQDLFQPILDKARPFCRGRYACVAVDDTRLHKTGRRIVTASYQRDPLSPKFRINLMFGLRFLQMSLLTPLVPEQQTASSCPPGALPRSTCLEKAATQSSPAGMGSLATAEQAA